MSDWTYGGLHPYTAGVRNALIDRGEVAAHTGEPWDEATLLAIAGGLGVGCVLWEFERHKTTFLTLGFRKDWHYPRRFLEPLCDRLGAQVEWLETQSETAAVRHLDACLARGHTPLAWVDAWHLPWHFLGDAAEGCISHVVRIRGKVGRAYGIDDLAALDFELDEARLAAARARIPSFKHRLMVITEVGECDVVAALDAGLRAQVVHLSSDSESFGLAALSRWAGRMRDPRHPRGWGRIFEHGTGLFGTLASLYGAIELAGEPGQGSLRGLYADALEECALLLRRPMLQDVALMYRELSWMWQDLGKAALPEDVAALHAARQLLDARHAAVRERGGDALAQASEIDGTLRSHARQLDVEFPLTQDEREDFLAELAGRVDELADAEHDAHAALARAMA